MGRLPSSLPRLLGPAAARRCHDNRPGPSDFDAVYWAQRWTEAAPVWHLPDVNPRLERFASLLDRDRGLAPRATLLPLCGRSVDLAWLHARGHNVVGVDLVASALEQFFRDHRLPFSARRLGPDRVLEAEDGRLRLYACDLYDFPARCRGREPQFDAMWDRGALVAVAREERRRYVDLVRSLMAPDCRYLLETSEFDPHRRQDPPVPVSDAEMEQLFEKDFHVETLEKAEASDEWLTKYGLDWGWIRTSLLRPRRQE